MNDALGVSLRFIRHYDPEADRLHRHDDPIEMALQLAMRDSRAIPFAEKLADALAFLSEQQQTAPK